MYEVSDGTEVVRSLVTKTGTLITCSITRNSEQVMPFTQDCVSGNTDGTDAQLLYAPYERMDEARQLCMDFTRKLQENDKTADHGHRRAKRGFTYPGTLWCGAGNMADHYNQLGDFAETDSCCRTHDHCPHVIHAFSSKFGYTNFKWHSISHCVCDEALKACLRKVNDTSSRVVGQAFFNVIEAPCFDITYEEQCVERHWYGLCKTVEKRPVAVIREAVPYDFGGIDVIDELTVAPSKKKDSNKSGQKVQPETTAQSPVSQPNSSEEPSLRNVVTAAEDFIKVLATVSTSQSSTAESDKSEAQSSEKKKKKTSEKKKKPKKAKGKGRKKKKQEAVVKAEDNEAVPLSSPKADEAMSLSNFISESEQPGRSSKKVSESEYELGREETSNEVMKDAPALDEEGASITPPNPIKKKLPKNIFLSTVSSSAILHKAKRKWLNKVNKIKIDPLSELKTTIKTTSPQEPILSTSEIKLDMDSTPAETAKVKRIRSKVKKDGGKRKKRLKASSAPVNANVEACLKESFTPLTTTSKQQLQQKADWSRVTPPHPSFSVLRTQRHKSKEKGMAKKKRKGSTFSNEQLSENNNEEATLQTLAGAVHSPPVTTTAGLFRDNTPMITKWQLFTTTGSPPVNTKKTLNKRRGKTKTNKSEPSAVRGSRAKVVQRYLHKQTALPGAAPTQKSSSSPQPTISTALSPMQITIEKVKEQFERKRRRKLFMLLHQ